MTDSMPAARSVRVPAASDTDGYWRFYDEVTAIQFAEWLPARRSRLLDLSAAAGRFALLAAAAGHEVVHVTDTPDPALAEVGPQVVVGDRLDLGWVRPGSFDAVIAEGCALSEHLAAEFTFERIQELLRPGGRLLLSVDSLVLGLAQLAGQERWAELADVPAADVVLVPNDDGSISRCFWPEELQDVLASDGFDVEWVRPRTVLSAETVNRALRADPTSLRTLVETEIKLAREREGESVGIHLVASARRR